MSLSGSLGGFFQQERLIGRITGATVIMAVVATTISGYSPDGTQKDVLLLVLGGAVGLLFG